MMLLFWCNGRYLSELNYIWNHKQFHPTTFLTMVESLDVMGLEEYSSYQVR